MNPMLASLSNTNVQSPIVQQVSQLRSMVGAVQNPTTLAESAVMNQLQSHPLYAKAKELADQYGGDWNRAFEETAKQNGIDPNMIRSMLKRQGLIR